MTISLDRQLVYYGLVSTAPAHVPPRPSFPAIPITSPHSSPSTLMKHPLPPRPPLVQSTTSQHFKSSEAPVIASTTFRLNVTDDDAHERVLESSPAQVESMNGTLLSQSTMRMADVQTSDFSNEDPFSVPNGAGDDSWDVSDVSYESLPDLDTLFSRVRSEIASQAPEQAPAEAVISFPPCPTSLHESQNDSQRCAAVASPYGDCHVHSRDSVDTGDRSDQHENGNRLHNPSSSSGRHHLDRLEEVADSDKESHDPAKCRRQSSLPKPPGAQQISFTATPAGLEGPLTRARAKALKSISRKGRPYSQKEDDLLQKLATEGLLWEALEQEFGKRFSGRSLRSLRTRWAAKKHLPPPRTRSKRKAL